MVTPIIHNPMLEDDDELIVARNPMLDDDESTTAEVRPALPRTLPHRPAAEQREPKFGEKGFGKGKAKPQRGTPRAHVTAIDAPYLAFLNEVQVADAVTLSTIGTTKATQVSVGGQMPTVGGTTARMRRLQKMGMVESVVSRDDRTTVLYGVTEAGIAAARKFGYLLEDTQPNNYVLKDMKRRTINHYRAIGQVAAGFVAGAYTDALGIGPISVHDLVSEPRMRREQDRIRRLLTEKNKDNPGFGAWRARTMKDVHAQVKAGTLEAADVLVKYPELRTIGQMNPTYGDAEFKDAHWPDLVIDLDKQRKSLRSNSVLVEVELSNKTWNELREIVATIAKEVEYPLVYDRAVYFTSSPSIKKRIERVDREFNLIARGKLHILPIEDRFGVPFTMQDTIGG